MFTKMTTYTRPSRYNQYGLPIYYSILKEKGVPKLCMSFRFPKAKVKPGSPEYGKILFRETHKLSECGTEDFVLTTLSKHAPHFWKSLFSKHAATLTDLINPEEGLPLAVAWAVDREELAEHLQWSPKTVSQKNRIVQHLLDLGWGGKPIGALVSCFTEDVFLALSEQERLTAICVLTQLASHEFGHKRLSESTLQKFLKIRRPIRKKKSSTCVRQHIRSDTLTQEQVHHIVDEMIGLLAVKAEYRHALALLLCLSMGLPLEELCYVQLASIRCDSDGTPILLHISGRLQKTKSRYERKRYPETSSKFRALPIPSKIASALRPLLQGWKATTTSKEAFFTRYLIPHTNSSQRPSSPAEFKNWINRQLQAQLQDLRMHDGNGAVISTRCPYCRCLATARQVLAHVGFDQDELRYFFGLRTSSTAGRYYCDFVSSAEQQRMRVFLDQWLGAPSPPDLCDYFFKQNPAAGTTVHFGAKDCIAHVVLTIDIPPLPNPSIPPDSYQLEFFSTAGFSLDARVLSLAKCI